MINRDIIPVCKAWKRKERIERIILGLCVLALMLIAYSCSYDKKVECLSSHNTTVGKILDLSGKHIIENQIDCCECHNRYMSMSLYFKRHGSSTPQLMATAVMETKRPKLMAAIAVKESGGNLKALGDHKRSKGAFQVQAKHWKAFLHEKKVSKDAITQALDSERILDALLIESNGDMKIALNAYNGDYTRKKYAEKILAELQNIP